MIDQGIYTRGKSFRAIAEVQARNYRYSVLGIEAFDRYGHLLTDRDAEIVRCRKRRGSQKNQKKHVGFPGHVF